jgi:hypothetical protein
MGAHVWISGRHGHNANVRRSRGYEHRHSHEIEGSNERQLRQIERGIGLERPRDRLGDEQRSAAAEGDGSQLASVSGSLRPQRVVGGGSPARGPRHALVEVAGKPEESTISPRSREP